ncbi:suppressor of fused domain protein, partial [Actinoplanes philippinensis]|uniref:suppressor of fused domain protein n=1 Tax=Actinoplanes philippinensis TaxID=35752 RepID=UPI00340E65FF
GRGSHPAGAAAGSPRRGGIGAEVEAAAPGEWNAFPGVVHGRPELCISVRSDDDSWASVAGFLAERLRGSCPFSSGNTIRFGRPVAPESSLTSFVVFAPSVLDRADLRIDVSPDGHAGHDTIHLTGLYPIHEDELRYITEHGLEAFWHLDWDMYDTSRQSVV